MAAAAVHGEQFNKILQCSICIDVFTDPRTLPCLHTFCIKCIADWCKDTQPGDKVTCPECREEFVIPDSGIDGLKRNFFVANMLSMNEVEQKTEELCEICVGEVEKVSKMFCFQCEQRYCESCSKAHLKIKNCQSHELVRLNELRRGVDISKKYRPQYCDKHTDKLIELYCLDDEVAICMMCCVLDHRPHRCEEIKNIANQFRTGKWKHELQNALSEVEDKLGVLTSNTQTFCGKIKYVETEICEEADKKIKMIKNHKQKLISSLQNIKTQHEREIDKVNKELTRAKALLSTFKDYCDELLKVGSDVDICREKNSLCRKTEELVNLTNLDETLRKLGVSDVIFSSSSVKFDDTYCALGELEAVKFGVLNDFDKQMMLRGTSTVTGRLNPQLLFTLDKMPTYSNGRPFPVSRVAILKQLICVVYWNYNKIQVFVCEDRSKKIKDIQVNGMDWPFDMVGCSVTSHLFLSDWFNGSILRVNVNTGVSDVFIKLGYNNAKLSLVENRLLVTSRDSLLMYGIHSGKRMKNIPYTEDMKKYGVEHAIESNRDSFFVSHGESYGGPSTVSEIDSQGRVVRVFNNKKKLNCCHLALDSAGRLLVADWKNNNVVLLDGCLQYLRIILDKEQLDNARPLRLNFNIKTDRLAVGLLNGHVKMFDWHGY